MAVGLRRRLFAALGLLALPAVGPGSPAPAAGVVPDSTGLTTRVSVRTGGGEAEARGPAAAGQPAVSDNGAVAFVSDATNLVPDDRNGVSDIFVAQNNVITRVSLGAAFAEGNGPSSDPVLSSTGQFVAFTSAADNLVPGDTNDALDVFVYDRQQSTVTRVSVGVDGAQADGDSRSPSINDAGSVVAFASSATNLVTADSNGAVDVFVRTLGSSPATELASVSEGGSGPGDGNSEEPSLDGSGTRVAFSSDAADLVADDANGHSDVFWRDLTADTTELVSTPQSGTDPAEGDSFSPSLSGDGEMVAFASDAENLDGDDNESTDVFLRNRAGTPSTTLVSRSCGGEVGNDRSYAPRISADTSLGNSRAGVSFVSDATNLLGGCAGVSAPDNNNVTDVYFRPLSGAPIVNERISRDTAGAEFNRPSLESAVSSDGRLVAFTTGGSPAGSDVFGRNRSTSPGQTALLSAPANGDAVGPAVTEFPVVSADGQIVAFASAAGDLATDDVNELTDVFVSDRARNQTARVSLGLNGAQANGPSATDSPPALSGDGRIIAFSSAATNLVADDTNAAGDIFVFDRLRKETTRVSVGPGGAEASGGDSFTPALSADGRYVAFASDATDLVGGDTNSATDVFVHDRQAKTTVRVSVGPGGVQTDQISAGPSISADGGVVAFVSSAHNLVPGDTNDVPDIFLRDLKTGTTVAVRTGGGAPGNAASDSPALSADGRIVAFTTSATNLVPGDTNNAADIVVFDRVSGALERVSVGAGGAPADRPSDTPSISADGRFVAFSSGATNLVPGDGNRRDDIFVRDRRLGATARVSVGPAPVGAGAAPVATEANQNSARPSLSGNGRFVAFQSDAGNLVAGDTNSAPDIFVHDRTPVRGYWLAAADGGIFGYGAVDFFGSTGAIRLAKPIVGMAASPTGRGYWLVASDGGIFAFGQGGFFGSTGALKLAQPIVGMAATPTGRGYWLVASDGGVFAFGDAGFFGSTGGVRLAQPIRGMAASPSGKGYWLVAADGGVFAFGDAAFSGSTGAIPLAQPIVGMAASPSGGGYWLAAADGGIFAFGDAGFFGSTGAIRLNRPIVGLSASPTGAGYWLVASDGGIFAFGDAAFSGSAGGLKLAQPIVGMAARP
jgi:Tol biopolymer transport system component